MRSSTSSSSAVQSSASTTSTTRSASSSAAAAVRFMALLSARLRLAVQARAYRRRRSARCGRCARCRGCGGAWSAAAGVTMLSFSPDERVEQRRFADVGPADERGEAAAKISAAGLTSLSEDPASLSMPPSMRSAASCSARRRLEPLPARREPQRRHLAASLEGLRVGLPLDALHAVARQREAPRLQILLQARLGVLERRRAPAARRCAARTAAAITGSAAARPPSRKIAPHSASRASARIDWRRKPPLLSSPEPSCSASPSSSDAATSASGSRLTSRARRRLRSPSVASGKAAIEVLRRRARLSTASPRNSSRSLLAPAALRCVSAARNSAGVARLVAELARVPSRAASRACSSTAAQSDLLVELRLQGDVGEQRRLVVVGGFDRPALTVAGDLDVLDGRIIDAVDLEVLLEGRANGVRRRAAAAAEFARSAHSASAQQLHVVQVDRRQADAGIHQIANGVSRISQPIAVTPRCLCTHRCNSLTRVSRYGLADAAPDGPARALRVPIEPDLGRLADQILPRDVSPRRARRRCCRDCRPSSDNARAAPLCRPPGVEQPAPGRPRPRRRSRARRCAVQPGSDG